MAGTWFQGIMVSGIASAQDGISGEPATTTNEF